MKTGLDILVTGSVAYDYLMTFPGYFKDHFIAEKLDNISLSFLVDSMIKARGGIAPNIAYTMSLLGLHPRLLAAVGEDFGDYRAWLESSGIDTTYARVIPGDFTASFFANIDRSNAQLASFYPGAMAHDASISINDVQPRPDLVIISPSDPGGMETHIAECRALGIPYLYDPSQQVARFDGDQLRRGIEGAHALFVNDYEFSIINKKTGLELEDVLKLVKFLVVTRGKQGSSVYAEGKEWLIPITPDERSVDPTGVGDAFRGGFISGYSLGLNWELCGQMGSLAATYCLEHKGTMAHHFTPAEFIARFRKTFDDRGQLDVLLQTSTASTRP